MVEENYEKFILQGIEERISVRKCIENEILIILFSLPLIVIERHNHIFLLLCLLPAILYFVFVIKVGKGKAIEGVRYILHNGVFSVSISLVFGLVGIDIAVHLFTGRERNVIICAVSTGYFLMAVLYSYMIKKLINRREYNSLKKSNGRIFFILCGVFGGVVARTFLNDISNQKAMELLCILCFFLSYLTLIGIFNIYKYRYLIKHQEILFRNQLRDKKTY